MLIIGKYKLNGSSIIEVVTSIFLITVTIALTAGLFSKTMGNSNLFVKHKAICALDELVFQHTKDMSQVPEEIDFENFHISVKIIPFEGNDELRIISYRAVLKSTGKQVYCRKLLKSLQNR